MVIVGVTEQRWGFTWKFYKWKSSRVIRFFGNSWEVVLKLHLEIKKLKINLLSMSYILTIQNAGLLHLLSLSFLFLLFFFVSTTQRTYVWKFVERNKVMPLGTGGIKVDVGHGILLIRPPSVCRRKCLIHLPNLDWILIGIKFALELCKDIGLESPVTPIKKT